MPQIPQISDSASKSYSSTLTNNHGAASGGEQFTVDGANKPGQIQAASDKNTSNNPQTTMGQKDLIPLAVSISKNQTLAVETIKDIINADLLSTAKLNGYTELAGELENLNSSLYISADQLLDEIIEQESQNTMFHNDKFYDLLRELSQTGNADLKEAIGNMLKAINFSQNKNEITSALSSNLKFLSEYFSPNRGLSQNLASLAERWISGEAETNFAALRNQTADLLKNVSESLLNDQHTQTLLPIVMHNISKYNTNSAMLREYFGQLLTQVPSYEMRNELATAFEKLMNNLTGQSHEDITTPFTNYTINQQENQADFSFFSKESQTFLNFSSYLTENLADEGYLSDIGLLNSDFSEYITDIHNNPEEGLDIIKNIMTGLIADDELSMSLENQFSQISNMNELVDFLNGFLETMPEGNLKNTIFDVMDEAVSVLTENDPFMMADGDEQQAQQAAQNSSIRALTDFVAKNINHPALKSIDSFNASNLLQSMINAPGVFTPLAHYILPIQVEDTRAFGELWVDNDDDSGITSAGGGQKHYHLFLTFDIDAFGRFELDVYANEDTASVSLLHPVSFGKNIESIISKVNRIAAGAGYSISNFQTGILKTPHNLSQIFPKLNERRTGLNVQA